MLDVDNVEWNLDYDGEDFTISLDDQTLKGMTWKPEGEVKFNYIFVHGLSVFVTFKKDFFPFITGAGGQVFGCDHIGHGRSPGSRASCTIDEIVEETKRVILHAKKTNPNVPTVLHGHSMGGLTVITLSLRFPYFVKQNINALIAEAPWIAKCPQREPNAIEMFGIRLLACIAPRYGVSPGVRLTSDLESKKWANALRKSKLIAPVTTPRLFLSAKSTIAWVRSNIDTWPNEVPLLFLHGRRDDLVDPKESEEWIEKLKEKYSTSDITSKFYDDGPHVLLKAKIREEVVNEMMNFIRSKSNL